MDANSSEEDTKPKAPKTEKITLPDPRSRVNTVARIPLENIAVNPFQPRTEFDDQALEELSGSIQEHGIIQPLTVRYLGEDKFELISGERRLRAARLAGIAEVPGYIIDADNEQMMAIALIENIQRADLNALEIAIGYKRLIEECNYTQEQLAKKVGKNRSTVTNMLRLLQLPDVIQRGLQAEEISNGHARSLLSLEDRNDQLRVYKKITKDALSVRQTEELVKKIKQGIQRGNIEDLLKKSSKDPFISDLEKKLEDHFSTRVSVKAKKQGGELRISYSNTDELQDLMEKMGL